jgi:hypothetical protein
MALAHRELALMPEVSPSAAYLRPSEPGVTQRLQSVSRMGCRIVLSSSKRNTAAQIVVIIIIIIISIMHNAEN